MNNVLLPDIPGARIHQFDGQHPPFRFACVPCGKYIPDWSLDQLPMLRINEFSERLDVTLHKLDALDVFVPATWRFNTVILPPGTFKFSTVLGNVCIWRIKDRPADGTYLLDKGKAVAISPGGCPVVVATYGDTIAVAHAGEKCLFDYSFVAHGRRTADRPNDSVVDSILTALGRPTADNLQRVHVWVFYSIGWNRYFHSLDDPTHYTYNRNLYEILTHSPYAADKCINSFDRNMHLHLPAIIARQFIARGVAWPNVNLEHSVLPVDDALFPTTRAHRPQDRNRRYLAVVVRL